MAVKSCSLCADGCEAHPDEPYPHMLSDVIGDRECGAGMACQNPTCALSWENETDPATGLVRPRDSDAPWRLASPVLRRSS